jgi:hypothetical protein
MPDPKDKLNSAYEATVDHWTHAEDTRWSLLNNYLTGNSILILAWAALFTSQAPYRRFLCAVLAVGGLFISILWAGLSHRGNGFIHMYANLGISIENELGEGLKRPEQTTSWFPFTNAGNHRSRIRRPARWFSSRFTVVSVPLVFALIYVLLACVAIGSSPVITH